MGRRIHIKKTRVDSSMGYGLVCMKIYLILVSQIKRSCFINKEIDFYERYTHENTQHTLIRLNIFKMIAWGLDFINNVFAVSMQE